MQKILELQMYDCVDQECVDQLLLAVQSCEERLKDAYNNYGTPMTKRDQTMLGCFVCALEQCAWDILEEMTEEVA